IETANRLAPAPRREQRRTEQRDDCHRDAEAGTARTAAAAVARAVPAGVARTVAASVTTGSRARAAARVGTTVVPTTAGRGGRFGELLTGDGDTVVLCTGRAVVVETDDRAVVDPRDDVLPLLEVGSIDRCRTV